ncbi:MAG: acetyl/propionyl/methylcrotonyl-CoA carboxylase subunit alpha [Burkholderiaceae bacterium]
MFKTMLIANSGEIAVRIIRGCRKLGVRTVAVYSEADSHAPHVALADAACLIGPPDAGKSYLNVDAIISAARRHGAEAIHPGYGFLSESIALITACEREGIVFVGPSCEAIRLMGSKIEAKRIAAAAGVPIVPGYGGDDQSDAALAAAAADIGYPVLIKASAGGGGKGMRVVHGASGFASNLDLVRREARSAFGDGDVLLERYIRLARHLEVQVLGDRHGHLLHLFERECSIQRNNQKVIEEAPAPHLDAGRRSALHAHALAVAGAVGYDSAGTVEFIHDSESGETFFLEMNTRLQVEHPVTEMMTGIDLVEWQLRVAAGESLPFAQADIRCEGCAIEARVCAENPAENFRPETGTVLLYREPVGPGVRVDSGVAAASVIAPYYDSLLAKVVVHADDRATCARSLAMALDDFVLMGVGTNLAFLADIVRRPEFTQPLSTRFLERAFPDGWRMSLHDDEIETIAAAVSQILALESATAGTASPWQSLGAWRVLHNAVQPGATAVQLEDEAGVVRRLSVSYARSASRARGHFRVDGFGAKATALACMQANELVLEIGDSTRRYHVAVEADRIMLAGGGRHRTWKRLSRWTQALAGAGSAAQKGTGVVASMPGAVTAVHTTAGARVKAGEVLILLEAMKMIQSLTAPIGGTVLSVRCRVGDTVKGGDILIEIETEEEPA